MQAAARLERHAERRRPQSRRQAGAGMLFQFALAALPGAPIPGRQPEVAFHRPDACAHAAQHAGAAQDVHVVAGRLLDQFKIAFALADQFARERERPAVQEAAAQRNGCAIRHQRGQLRHRALFVLLIETRSHCLVLPC
ncbi:hypothetical protein G6F57_020402 [Rhizopus arrhizus]|nr:hypothetical protein G6F57_020402 [Rhizopus arrhizus]